MFETYEKKWKRQYDFLVNYEFIKDQKDYITTLKQGMRSDFCYEEDCDTGPIYMVWPEFLDKDGNVILNTDTLIDDKGSAHMWILLDETRPIHKKRIQVGKIGYLTGGSHKIAKVIVTEIAGIKE